MPTNSQIPVAEYARKVSADLRPTLQAARRTIKALAPKGTKELAWRTWPIRYSVADTYVVGVGNYPRWISLYFFRGAELDDPGGVLEGSGKGMRHIKLRGPKDASSAAVKEMIRQAFKMGGITMRGEAAESKRTR